MQDKKEGAVRIGRGGAKLHPAVIDPRYGLIIQCHCPGTQNGSAARNAQFFKDVKPTCGAHA